MPLFQTLSPASREQMEASARMHRYRKKEYLFRIRDRVDRIYLITSGYAVIERDSQDHGTKSIFLLHEGDLINEVILDHANASVNCYALTDLEAVSFSKAQFLALMKQDFTMTTYVVDSMALKIRKLYHQVESSTKPTRLSHQVASRLWKFGRDFGVQKGDALELPFDTRITFLASFVGSNRETVSRIIKKMADQHILTIQNGTCRIYDMDALKEYAALEGHSQTPVIAPAHKKPAAP